MRKQNGLIRLLKDKTGASFMFVLGIMLLLMAIGISALVAASANTGFSLRQKELNRIIILDDAIHKNIMYSLQNNPNDASFLWKQLVVGLCEARISSSPPPTLPPIDVNVGGIDLVSGNVEVESVTFFFPQKLNEMVIITNIPDEPKTAAINAKMIVTVKIVVNKSELNEKTVTSEATYIYTGGRLSIDDPSAITFAGTDKYGKWELMKYEKVDL